MKKRILHITLFIILIVFTGCGNKRTASAEDVAFLTSTKAWWFYDEVTGESEKMVFHEDFTFYWGCECGEPIGNSDLYELYDYDKESQVIRLYNGYDDTSLEMTILDYSNYHLMLEIEGEIKDYTYMDGMYEEPRVEEMETYLSGYHMYAWMIECQGLEVVVGPFNYDGDVEYPDNAFKTYVLADDIEFYDLQITCWQDADTGEETLDVGYAKLSKEDGMARLEGGYGFIWFNDNMEIEKVTYYGSLIIYE